MELLLIFLRPYLRLLEGGVFANLLPIVFTALSFWQAYQGVPVARVLWRKWAAWQDKPLTAVRKQVAEQAAFFVAVPISIFIHEAGHAVAVLAFGGQVLEFGFFFFWGYVLPAGEFSPLQYWIIASAGTWGNLLFALGVWWAWRGSASRFVRYLMLRTVRFQIFYALIYYPIFTRVVQVGDWRTIYDFTQTPWLSGITAVLHIGILAIHIWGDRQGWYEMAAVEDREEAEMLAKIEAHLHAHPDELTTLTEYVERLRQGGAINQAQRLTNQTLRRHPTWAEGYLLRALSKSQNTKTIPAAAVRDAQEGLRLGLKEPLNQQVAHQILGSYALAIEQYEEAVAHFTRMLAVFVAVNEAQTQTHGRVPPTYLAGQARAHAHRAEVYRRQRQYQLAHEDLLAALRLAEQAHQPALVEGYRQEIAQNIQPYL